MYATIQLRTLEGFKGPDRWMRRRGLTRTPSVVCGTRHRGP